MASLDAKLSILGEKFDYVYGIDQINNLKEQNKLLQQQLQIQNKLKTSLTKERNSLKKYLSGKGVKFDKDGNSTNYVSMLKKKEAKVEELEKKYNKSQTKGNQKKYEQAKKELEELKTAMDRYVNISTNELPQTIEQWYALQNAINSNILEIEELKENLKFDIELDLTKKFKDAFEIYEYHLQRVQALSENASGEDKVKLLKEEIVWLEKKANALARIKQQTRADAGAERKSLTTKGFEFNEAGYITNYDEMMKKYEKYVNDSKTNVERELREKEVEQLLKSLENYENYMKEYRDASND